MKWGILAISSRQWNSGFSLFKFLAYNKMVDFYNYRSKRTSRLLVLITRVLLRGVRTFDFGHSAITRNQNNFLNFISKFNTNCYNKNRHSFKPILDCDFPRLTCSPFWGDKSAFKGVGVVLFTELTYHHLYLYLSLLIPLYTHWFFTNLKDHLFVVNRKHPYIIFGIRLYLVTTCT